ncbi:hypothetical protein NQ315_012007 [Exocentrus adspersus]|uniref:Uncharacterized protein n=1 Tax=Exocentrus adspersus TaxID=1586481 RepID=A0AAV8W2R7_9CUCU|nr:hypothetical protein NQ315_012007 [Exocentrus adspersus]
MDKSSLCFANTMTGMTGEGIEMIIMVEGRDIATAGRLLHTTVVEDVAMIGPDLAATLLINEWVV